MIRHCSARFAQAWLQESRGEALLYFCQQDGALEALKRLTTAESTSLHAVCAWLLWHGLRCGGVITALAGVQGASSTRGLALLGRLLQSVDLGARVLASLCIGAIVRYEGALDADTRDFCLRALAVLPSELDAAEEAALAAAARDDLQKGSLRDLAKPQSLASLPASEPEPFRKESEAASHSSFESRLRRGSKTKADDKNEFSVSDSAADSKSAVSKLPVPQRDPALVKLLGEICSSKELSRMQMLLGPCQAKDDYGGVDTVTACMVAILDHFVQQCTDKDSARIHDLLPLMPQLQKLVEGDEDGQMVEGGVGGAAAGEPPPQQVTREEVRVRASRVLLRLAKEANHEATREPPQLEAFGPRAHILEVLMRHSEACQVGASGHVSQTQEHCQAQGDHIAAGGLAEDCCSEGPGAEEAVCSLFAPASHFVRVPDIKAWQRYSFVLCERACSCKHVHAFLRCAERTALHCQMGGLRNGLEEWRAVQGDRSCPRLLQLSDGVQSCMAAHGIFQRQFGEDSLTATEIDVSSNEDEPSRRSPCLLPLPGIAVPPVLDAPVPRLPSSPRESGTSFSSAALFTEVADLTSAESPSGNPQRLPPKDEEDLPLSVIFAAGLPSTPRLSKAGDGSDSSDVVEIPIPQGSTPKVKRGCHLISSPETTPRKARPRLASPDHGTPRTATPKKPTPKKATPDRAPPKKATPEKATPKKSTPEKAAPPKKPAPERASLTGGRSPKPPAEPEAKAQKRKTLAQRLQDRQKTARQAKAKAKAKVSKAEAYKAKVERTEQLLADTIRGDRKFYEKLLCFEVMEIEELAKKIRSANEGLRSLGRKRIRDFLEAQGFVVTQQKKLPREGMVVSLDQRRVKYGILGQDVQELCRSLHAMAGDTTRSTEVHAELSHCEELERQSVGEVEQLSAKLREAQAWNQSSATKVKEAEKNAAELSSKEAELADFCNQVPAKLQQHQSRLVDVATQRADAAARRSALGLEADRCERRIAALRSAAAEAATALRALEDVSQELEVLKSSLNSELVMSAGEVEKLRSLGARLVPAKPGRMRRSASNASEEESDAVMAPSSFREAIAPDAETPTWDSAAEEEFRENENFRSFKKLRDEKERLWQREKRWLQECLDHAETAASKLDQQRREAQSLEHQSATEEGDLQKEIAILEDVEGHAQRHLDARAAADAARASQRELATIAAEAAAAEWAAKAQLEKAQANAAQAWPGDLLKVVGADAALGCWQPERSFAQLQTTAALFPLWQVPLPVLLNSPCKDEKLEYRYAWTLGPVPSRQDLRSETKFERGAQPTSI
ncbi:TMPRSS13 [Symbiodinium sp. CCMP2592]|nr:TMPRSS13 [Symbiodinium sp. CCMP2592]